MSRKTLFSEFLLRRRLYLVENHLDIRILSIANKRLDIFDQELYSIREKELY